MPSKRAAGAASLVDDRLVRSFNTALAGRYAIERELGRGGNATVYLARDERHPRHVAIKIIHAERAQASGTERFLREIRIAADLQHPHILGLHDSGEVDGAPYYVMPYVDGESLRARLDRARQLPVDEALRIAREVAGALDYAHRRGVVHRDVKPENILIEDGHAVLADFGIARAMSGTPSGPRTATGTSVGTPAYMSPEQAAGERDIDGRSDIYALGCVLYEMLAGEPPFTGPTAESVIRQHLIAPAPLVSSLRASVPPAATAAIARALMKAPADRFETASEFAGAAVNPNGGEQRLKKGKRWRAAVGALAGVILIGLLVVGVRVAGKEPDVLPATRRQLTFLGNVNQAAISPDGKFIAYTVEGDSVAHLIVQDVDGGPPDTVESSVCCLTLEWSPDGSRLLVAVFRRAAIIPRLGGPTMELGIGRNDQSTGLFGYWLPDGERVSLHFSDSRRIWIVDLETEDTVAIPIKADHWSITDGAWSPDGRLFAMVLGFRSPIRWAIGVMQPDGRTELVVEDSVLLGSPQWSTKGNAIYYMRDLFGSPAIRRIAVAPTGRARGSPEVVHADLDALPVADGFSRFSIARDGRQAVYTRGIRYTNLWVVTPTVPGSPPVATPLTSGTARIFSPAVSPDGRWIAFAKTATGANELHVMPIDGGAARQVTSGARVWHKGQIAWSPDGTRLAFQTLRAGRSEVWVASVSDGKLRGYAGTTISQYTGHITWAPREHIAYLRDDRRNIQLIDPTSGTERSLLPDTGWVFNPSYSPDGNQIAFTWNRGPGDGGLFIHDFRDSSFTKQAGRLPPRAWS